MSLSKSDFADGLKAFEGCKDIPDAVQKWTDAWEKYISKCTQIATPAASVAAFKSSIAGAFAPIPSPVTFFTMLQTAMTAGLTAAVLKPTYGAPGSLVPNPAPIDGASVVSTGLGSKNHADPKDALAEKVHNWTIVWAAIGIPPDFSGAGPLS
jgi:hypothetical protein